MINNYKSYISKNHKKSYLILAALLANLIFLGMMIDFSFIRIYQGIPSMYNLLQRMMTPNLSYTQEVFSKLLETIEIAMISSLIGVILAIPFALLTARNITPSKYLSILLNFFFSFLRTVPNLIWAALLVSIFSIGQFSGILALTITALLISLKLFRENIETINENLLNATRSVGANQIQVLRYSVLPTILELSVSVFFMVLEINIRSATVLGLVGAGGIGQIMWRDLNHLRYDNLATLVLILFFTIISIDGLSFIVRKSIKKSFINFQSVKSHKSFCKKRVFILVSMTVVAVILVISSIDIHYERFKMGLEQGGVIISRMMKVELAYLPKLFEGIGESFFIAIFATITGAIGSIFLSFFTAYNTSPSKSSCWIFKGITNILRTFPPIITAIILFRGVGPGPLAGGVALSIYTTGVLTKLYSEVIENTHENIKNSILVTGCSNLDSFRHGILPQTLPTFISLVLYRLESNIRTSTILGIIGAGGVGTILTMNITWRNWERVGLLILGISMMIISIDTLSYYLRKKIS
ncbi:phosphonate ABC transporter, permease protein PhnE [Clostridium aceticum]|uniref:Phosphonate ABC transporter, permease protein PhnE n=1 Tax=Clostridium aceticum TaxID=84022 RepID=A0A0D8I9H5_9CLOT|nr:phosphonate ABC transporter, permease protein PhnE [Clostridium aceticum]AKL96310.1 phosphonate ABC transporter, permease protein PhnE [Clostridium aceticum]KJF26908.1 phosphonate ABC transporter permease [Clostridium aceticum]